ncbi:MAG: hypothetical protein COA79_11540 [Planctomycetota bacterium]|nr:MAG: hypothetical protein COA79_11540 [Planctomycetota bacterium]
MDGFLPYKATFMLDMVVLALLAVVPILLYGIWLAKKKEYSSHAKVMTSLGLIVLFVVILFELSMIYHGGIEKIMENAERSHAHTNNFLILKYIHIFFSTSTCFIWFLTIYQAIKRFGIKDPKPNDYSKRHKTLAIIGILDIFCVAITGLLVYYFAFIN